MDDRRVADYFVIAGLPDNPLPLDDFSRDGASLKATHNQAPIIDVAVIFPSLGEEPPEGYTLIETTPTGFPANLNHGSFRNPSVFLCYRRGREKSPLVDVGVFYEGTKEKVIEDCEVIHKTPYDRCANVNNSGSHTFITYRRASELDPCNVLVVTDICVILHNKGENPPRTFCRIDKDLNRSLVGSNVFLCYKKSMNRANSIAYKPATLGRFPLGNMPDFPLPDSVPLFCLPMGSTVECWPSKAGQPEPVFSTFVLTVSDAVEKVYGAAVTFYELYSVEKLSAEEKLHLGFAGKSEQTVNVNKSMCILSHWPFFDTFERFLMYLHNMSVSGPHSIPIERYISHFMHEIPFPSPQRPRILIQLEASEIIVLAQLEDSPLPLSGASFTELLKTLGPDNCLAVLLFALTEQKILVHSLRPDVLTSVAEAISMLIFPFHWQCPYIPLCPLGLSDVLSAPMPYIVGVDSRYFDMYDPPSDVYCINLDTHTISNCDDRKPLNIKLLPKKPMRALDKTLISLFDKLQSPLYSSSCLKNKPIKSDADLEKYFKMKKFETMIEIEIQEAFLRFMATILKGFRSCLLPITRPASVGSTDANALFDIHGFLKSRDKTYHRFYSLLMKTQMFTRFIEERSFVTDKDASLAFFDECTEKVDYGDGREVRLIESDESHKSERTVYVPLPEMTGLTQGASYSYKKLGKLNPMLFHNKQPKHFLSVSNRASPAPSSPMARRTKQEIRSAQKLAQKHSKDPREWVKCLKSYCFCLWFIHLPAYVKETRYKCKTLKTAFEVLVRMQYFQLQPFDEVCYRVLMQLCGQYGEPVLAIKLLTNMKNSGVQPNAITYGYYNKAVLESKWPSQNTKNELWNKLRYAVLVVGQFRRGLKLRPNSVYSESDAASSESGIPDDRGLATRADSNHTTSKPEDHESGQSDVGYSSLNLDDTQQSSSSINSGSQARSDSTDSDKVEGQNCKPEKAPANGPLSNSLRKISKDESKKKCSRNLKYDEIDFSESNAFRARNGSIVRSSACILANHNTLNAMRGSATVNSSAGLLIPGQSIFDDDVFLSEEKDTNALNSSRRKRHHTSESEEPDNDGGRLRHSSGTKPSPYGPSPQGVQECDSGTELLHSGSYGSDARILSHLSKSSCDDVDTTFYSEDDVLHTELSDHVLNVDLIKERESLKFSNDHLSSQSDVPLHSGQRSPNIPIKNNDRNSTVTSPTLTPVTQNDPLGVFSTSLPLNSIANTHQSSRILPSVSLESPASIGSTDLLMKEMLSPELFRNEPKRRTINMGRSRKGGGLMVSGMGASVPRSASFSTNSPHHNLTNLPHHEPLVDNGDVVNTSIHRSNTVPNAAGLVEDQKSGNVEGNPMSPLYNQWSSLTSRLQALTPSRKTDSPLFGSVQTWKSLLTNKLSEIKESISSKSFPNTPIKTHHLPKPYEMENKLLFDEDEEEGVEETCQVSVDFLPKTGKVEKIPGEEISEQRSSTGTLERAKMKAPGTLPHVGSEHVLGSSECLAESSNLRLPSMGDLKKVTATTALEIQMTSCSRCHSCQSLLYDEEIMTNWSAEESDLNTRCAFCKSKVVPILTVIVKDYRSESAGQCLLSPAQSIESMQSAQSLSTLSMCPSRKTSISSHQEPLFTLEDSPESTSVPSSVSSPVGSPQKQPSYLHCGKSACSEIQDNNPIVKCNLPGNSDFDAPPAAKRFPLNLVNGGSTTNVSEVLQKDVFKGRLTGLQENSLPSSITSSTVDICGDASAPDAAHKELNFVPVATLDPIIVPYLSPIVLRKELETVLDDEGDICLTQPNFVDKHPIIFWNLLWYCTRINVPTHLPGLCLKAKAVNKDRPFPKNWALANSHNVIIRCMWDNPKLHEEMGQAMYMTWNTTQSSTVNALVTEPGSINRGVIQQIISGIQCDDVSSPLKIIISELRKRRAGFKGRHYSIYRDLLFLCISYIGRQNINLVAFDREYRRAFRQLSPSQRHLLQRYDYPLTDGAILCRQFFGSMELL